MTDLLIFLAMADMSEEVDEYCEALDGLFEYEESPTGEL